MKAVDLRLQLGHAENKVRIAIEFLPELMSYAKRSRQAITAMNGQSGAFQAWNNAYEEDVRSAAKFAMDLALVSQGGDYKTLKAPALADKVVKLHELELRVLRLAEKYKSSVAEDDQAREERRADIRATRG